MSRLTERMQKIVDEDNNIKSALKLQELVKEKIKDPDTNMARGITLLQSLVEESEK